MPPLRSKRTFFAPDEEDKRRDPNYIKSVLSGIKIEIEHNETDDYFSRVYGRVEAQFTIAPDGTVKDVVLSGDFSSRDGESGPKIKEILLLKIQRLKFEPADSEDHIRTPFKF